jgi:deoxyribonuclease-4
VALRFGPSGIPSHESPDDAVGTLVGDGYDAAEIEFGRGFWMARDFAERLGALAAEADVALSMHAPLAAFLGHAEAGGRKHNMAVGMLDHAAGLAVAAGAAPVVIHPGFLLGRTRAAALDAVVEQLGALRERLEPKGRAVAFGIEVMGRVAELGTLDDVLAIAGRVPWVRPVLDFAHALAGADAVLEPGAPFHIHFSDISYANRNEKSHLPYGEGTLRAEPLAAALARFERPATVISESPDAASTEAIGAVLRA